MPVMYGRVIAVSMDGDTITIRRYNYTNLFPKLDDSIEIKVVSSPITSNDDLGYEPGVM